MEISPMKKYVAECFGTFVLTFFGCGSAAILGSTLGTLGIAFAFGLSIVAMAFVIGDVSGCQINPAVSLAMYIDNRMSGADFVGYIIAQFIGGFIAALLLWLIIDCCGVFFPFGVLETGLGCNGFDAASSVGMNVGGALLIEVILTGVFVMVVLGSTASEKTAPFAGLIIGLALTFVHIMGIPNTGTSVNPARSFGPALVMAFNGDSLPIEQVWVFIVAPALGGVIAALFWRYFRPQTPASEPEPVAPPVYGAAQSVPSYEYPGGFEAYPGQPEGYGQPTYPGQPDGYGQPAYPGQPDGFDQPAYPGAPQGYDQQAYPGAPQAVPAQPPVSPEEAQGYPQDYGYPGQPAVDPNAAQWSDSVVTELPDGTVEAHVTEGFGGPQRPDQP